ncbi:unnamed protein product [Cylindrotheca closterium]|uniref:Uncharacterized protein n=1 Tax=Cylindrotheca closterium TaxID=2856 RepID=A0AAD2FHN7_9STRA|nr:unnamed protein product [Cylindrotheca closterium]
MSSNTSRGCNTTDNASIGLPSTMSSTNLRSLASPIFLRNASDNDDTASSAAYPPSEQKKRLAAILHEALEIVCCDNIVFETSHPELYRPANTSERTYE